MGGLPLCIPGRGRGEWGVLARVLGQRLQAKMGVSRGGAVSQTSVPSSEKEGWGSGILRTRPKFPSCVI